MSSDFARLGVPSFIVSALAERGITVPTPIQAATLPDSLAGRDVLGRGRTGSGKTFAFLAPLVSRLAAEQRRAQPKRPRGLVLAPTRELAIQIAESLEPLQRAAGLRSQLVFGGVNQNPQVKALAAGVDIVIACPGRLLDLMGQKAADLGAVEITVIDEADHMADMGFLPMVRRILDATPRSGQRMLFSATLDDGIGIIAKKYLSSPVVHEADSAESPVATMEHHVLRVPNDQKVAVVADLAAAPGRTIVFTRTKHGAKKLAKQLLGRGVPAVELHGNLSQNARTRNMDAFHDGRVGTLVATDIAARGIHVDDVALVVHADPPAEHKAYLHRSGRTARAGASGTVVTLAGESQLGEVRTLMKQAKISALIADGALGDPALQILAPGERSFLSAEEAAKLANPNAGAAQPQQAAGSGRARSGGGRR
ncbi:DEAD/DEAH box helicase, partial [Cumulibacter manganitolerans]|uniref:DEAD/DEAH box helicase n=1 Tax=Cumulibacter manganitolerans TaxID=1884992 RepID=UPI0012966356